MLYEINMYSWVFYLKLHSQFCGFNTEMITYIWNDLTKYLFFITNKSTKLTIAVSIMWHQCMININHDSWGTIIFASKNSHKKNLCFSIKFKAVFSVHSFFACNKKKFNQFWLEFVLFCTFFSDHIVSCFFILRIGIIF